MVSETTNLLILPTAAMARMLAIAASVEKQKVGLRALGMTEEQAEEAARLSFSAATQTLRPNSEAMRDNLDYLTDRLAKGEAPADVLAAARKLWA